MKIHLSVIMTVYNGQPHVGAALDSLLHQTRAPDELIVVDDGSTDDTADLIATRYPQIRLVRQANAGVAAARNRGISMARGNVIALADADDLYPPVRFQTQLEHLATAPEPAMVFGHMVEFRDQPAWEAPPTPAVLPGALLLRREDFDRVGLFRDGLKVAEFLEWYLRAQAAGLRDLVPSSVVVRRRLHAMNIGVVDRAHRVNYVRVLKEHLDRRRAGPAT